MTYGIILIVSVACYGAYMAWSIPREVKKRGPYRADWDW